MTINLIDTIGVETGMHKYDDAFVTLCEKERTKVNIISNYNGKDVTLLLHNYYHGSILKRICFLFYDFFRLLIYEIKNNDQYYIYQSFGFRLIDIFFYIPLIFNSKSYLLIHDLFELNARNKSDGLRPVKKILYKKIKRYICHSKLVKNDLEEITTYKSHKIILVPHFEYTYTTDYDNNNIPLPVKSVINSQLINILFFGQVSKTKGVDILLEAFPLLNENVNVIIAGVDKSDILLKYTQNKRLHFISRYIQDEELNFLFSSCDIVVMPYREIYQSGVLETVIHFQKPVIMSSVKSFREYKLRYPSFGECYYPNTPESLANCINNFNLNKNYYNQADLCKYNKEHSIKILLQQL